MPPCRSSVFAAITMWCVRSIRQCDAHACAIRCAHRVIGAPQGDRPTPESLARYRSDFGDDWFAFWCVINTSSPPPSPRANTQAGVVAHRVNRVCCIVIDSSLLNDPAEVEDEAAAQFAWLKQTLESARAANVCAIVFELFLIFFFFWN